MEIFLQCFFTVFNTFSTSDLSPFVPAVEINVFYFKK